MKTKFLVFLLLFSPDFFTSCDDEFSPQESCEDLGCQWYQPLDESEFRCSC